MRRFPREARDTAAARPGCGRACAAGGGNAA